MKEIMDESMIQRSIKRISHEILERNKGAEDLVILGIKSRGEYIAQRITKMIKEFEGIDAPCASFDIKYWRDDIDTTDILLPELDVLVANKKVVLVDDVLFKGRTVRAAMDGVMHFGRAKSIQLAVLVDRGHRELPIRADYVGKNIPTNQNENVKVELAEIDEKDGVYII